MASLMNDDVGFNVQADKVFTINQESKYIIIINVQATGLEKELAKLCASQGLTSEFREIKDYPNETFTQAFLVKYSNLSSARRAKRYLDERYFYGSMLHVFYAPEHETIQDVREKIQDRRLCVVGRLRSLQRNENKKKIEPASKKPYKIVQTKPIPAVLTDEPVAVWNAEPVYEEEVAAHMLVPQKKVVEQRSCNDELGEDEKPTQSLKRKFHQKSEVIQNKYKKLNVNNPTPTIPIAKTKVFLPRSLQKQNKKG